MVAGLGLALVLRTKGGSNFLIQTRGITAKTANEASREVATVLSGFTSAQGEGDMDGSGDNPPGFTYGEVLVQSGRLRVVYRLVNTVYVMAVAAPAANVFFCMQVVEAVTRMLVMASKGVEVTPDKVTKRYPEVYMATGALMANGGTDIYKTMAEAEAAVASIAPDSARAKTLGGQVRKSITALGKSKSGSSKEPSTLPSADNSVAAHSTINNRKLAEEVDPLNAVSFTLPPEALETRQMASPDNRQRQAPGRPPLPQGVAMPSPIGRTVTPGGLEDMLAGMGAIKQPQAANDDPFGGQPADLFGAQATGDPFGGQSFNSFGSTGPSGQPPPFDAFGGQQSAGDPFVQGSGYPSPVAIPSPAPTASSFGTPGGPGGGFADFGFATPSAGLSVGTNANSGWAGFDSPQPTMPSPETPASGLVHTSFTPAMAMVADAGWAAFGSVAQSPEQQWKAFGQSPAGTEPAARQAVPEASAVQPATAADERAVEEGEGLKLVELWRAAFLGDQLVRAGTYGQVLGSGSLPHSQAKAAFRLRPPPKGPRILSAGLRCALLDRQVAQRAQTHGTFIAHVGRAPQGQMPFLKYHLPAVACLPPILLRVSCVFSLASVASQQSLLVVVQYTVNPSLPGPLEAAVLDLDVPKACGNPGKVSPKASWAPGQRRMRWDVGALEPGTSGAVRVAFTADSSGDKLAAAGVFGGVSSAATQDISAKLHFHGTPGASLSGILLESGSEADSLQLSQAAFHAQVVAQPAR
ncbi:hypothetical protein WJX72_005642 [[Myrmecia] bisecta]|uniref:MHD domain-containing protein n=1 Tax=[Myrmecia] bisecta TaxID=41462 RepID=A0AAW1PUA9_9CHLO